MKKINLKIALTGIALLLVSSTVFAHDRSKHKGKQEAPDCEAMKDMDHMDKMDPVMMAMMEQCSDEHDDDHEHGDNDHEDKHDDDHHGNDEHH